MPSRWLQGYHRRVGKLGWYGFGGRGIAAGGWAAVFALVAVVAACERECAWCTEGFSCHRVIVRFETGTAPERVDEINAGIPGDVSPGAAGSYVVALPDHVTVCDAIGYYEAHEEVEFASPDSEIDLLGVR